MEQMTVQEFWERFLVAVPEFSDAYQQELDDEFGELLPHLMMGITLVPFLEARAAAASTASDLQARQRTEDVVRRALTSLEEGLGSGDDQLQNVILISFLEN